LPDGVSGERERLAARLPLLRERARLNSHLRQYFFEHGFLEIEAPLLVPSPGLEVHLDAFVVDNARPEQRFLITSPEYQMKRLVAGGVDRCYSLGKVFRRGERGRHHNPEFTMLEWYVAGWGWAELATSVEELVSGCAALFGTTLPRPWHRSSVRELFTDIGVELDGDESTGALRAKLSRFSLPTSDRWEDLFFTVFLDEIEPRMNARDRPTVVYDWPRPLAALARARPDDPRVVERFEAYLPTANGLLELCNGFGELVDPVEQRARCEDDLRRRAELGLPAYPIDERFLAALGDMPPSAGVALGVDRLAMWLLHANDIADVLPFAVEEL
jgi:lysyl-tRNA synthetase class 2